MLWLTIALIIISFGAIALIQKQLLQERVCQAQHSRRTLPAEDSPSDLNTELYVDS